MACLFPLHRNYRDVPTQRVSGGGGQRNYRVNYYAGSTDPQFDDDLNKILEDYLHRNAGTNASVLMPIGGLRALNNLIHIAKAGSSNAGATIGGAGAGWLLVLAGDKAYTQEQEMLGLRDPHVALHGSFSFMVNFHSVGLFAQRRGGFALQTPYLDGFKCACFSFGATAQDLPEVRLQWMESPSRFCRTLFRIERTLHWRSTPAQPWPGSSFFLRSALCDCMTGVECFGPDNFSTFQRSVKDESPSASLKNVMAVLRLSQFDTDVFYKFKQVLIDKAPFASEKQQHDIKRDILEVFRCYYPLQKSKDIAFEIGRLMMGLKEYVAIVSPFISIRWPER